MRLSLPLFLQSRFARLRPARPGEADVGADPADMGTDFGLEAWLAARPAAQRGRAAAPAQGELPLDWLGGPAARRQR